MLLVTQAQEGDALAFARLYAIYRDKVLVVCRSRVRDYHAAEDLTQEAFVRAFTAIESLDGQRLFYPWLRRIAVNLTLDHLNRRTREQVAGDAIEEIFPASDLEWAYDDTVIDASRLQSALGELTERHRAVLRQRADGWSLEHIAAEHQISPSAAKVLAFRARRRLASAYHFVGLVEDGSAEQTASKGSGVVPYPGRERRREPMPIRGQRSLPDLVVETRPLWTLGGRSHEVMRFVVIAALRGRSSRGVPAVVHLRQSDLTVAASLAGVTPSALCSLLRKEGVLRERGPRSGGARIGSIA